VNRHEALPNVHDSCPLLVSYDSDDFKPLAPNDDDGINKEVSQKKRQSRFRC
jgi:hypothetical protein